MRGYQIEQDVVTNVAIVPENAIQTASGLSWDGGGLVNGGGKSWILSESGGIGWSLVDGALVAPTAPERPLGTDAIDAERDRRIAAGFVFEGVQYQSGDDDRENIAGAATAALGAMVHGAEEDDLRWHGGDDDFVWIATDNTMHTMDAPTMFAFGQAALKHKQDHIFAGRAIKDMDPLPTDYADDQYWPA